MMKAGYRYISFLFLTAALSAPAAIVTRAASQDEHRDEHHDQKRVYDRVHKDYHNWDGDEDRYYHQYFTENHREYRDYSKLNRKDQDAYWTWRHEHGDDRH
jgi:NADH dehydrogenase/NADH:ubiquinone oxidoreductase subunit G